MYHLGLGVVQDNQKAMEWSRKAAEQGNKNAQERYERIKREIDGKEERQRLEAERRLQSLPASGIIAGNKVNVRAYPSTSSSIFKQLNAGHPVSVTRRSFESDGDWYYVKTASGTEGWVKGDYVALNTNVKLTQQELENRRKSLPARGVVSIIRVGNRTGNKLNLRNIPSAARTAKVITELTAGDGFTAYEIFVEEGQDWYRIRTDDYEEGWVSGRFIELRY